MRPSRSRTSTTISSRARTSRRRFSTARIRSRCRRWSRRCRICIVFVPMFLLAGIAKFLFIPLAEAVVFAMLASYLLSRTLVPTLAKFWLKKHDHDARKSAEQFARPVSGRIRARASSSMRDALPRAACSRALRRRPALRGDIPRAAWRPPRCWPFPSGPCRASGRISFRRSTAARSSCTCARAPARASRRPRRCAMRWRRPSAR